MKFAAPIVVLLVATPATTSFVIPRQQHQQHSLGFPLTSRPIPRYNSQLDALPSLLDGAIKTASSATDAVTSSPLFVYFLQTLISYAVPAFFTILTIFFAAASFRKRGNNDDLFFDRDTAVSELYSDLYGDGKDSRGGGFSFGSSRNNNKASSRRNLGIPSSEYLKITHLNEQYDSYDFSLVKATQSKAVAASQYRSRAFDRALRLALAGGAAEKDLPAHAKTQLLEAEKEFLRKGKSLVAQIQQLETKLAKDVMDDELQRLGLEEGFEMDPKDDLVMDAEIESSNTTSTTNATSVSSSNCKKESRFFPFFSGGKSDILQSISKLQRELKLAELDFLQDVIGAVGTKRGMGIRAALLGDIAGRGSGGLLTQLEDRPLSTILQSPATQKSLFVMEFPGDIQASQLNNLREEVTAVIRNAKPGDEALVVLQSGGGTVTGYGLAAGQLVRLKEAGLFLTMAVEQVAASGGYMMACVADRIVASPFAVLGSIGVISEVPNAYERLKQEGIEFQTVTAGKFKRTLTPTKKVTKADLDKSKEDLEQVLGQFASFVKENRPSLDIDSVATGETWFGKAALERGLCDDIQTVDDILLNYVDLGYNVYEIKYSPPPPVPEGLAQLLPVGGVTGAGDSLVRKVLRWMVGAVADEVRSVMDEQNSVPQRYLAKDDTSERVQMRE